VFIDLLNYYIN